VHLFIEGVLVTVAPEDSPPYPVDAIVLEEDTQLVLSAPPVIPEQSEHPIRIMTALLESEPRPLGSVIVRAGLPPRLLAVVHDLNRDPSADEDTVRAALRSLSVELDRLQAKRVRMPLLGAVHGVISRSQSIELITEMLREASPPALRHLWIVNGA
jgi:hypothetical protein